jgi:hypothetical protein
MEKFPPGWGEVNGNIVNYKKFVSKGLKILEMAAMFTGKKKDEFETEKNR